MFNKIFLFPGTDRKTGKSTYNNDCIHSKNRGKSEWEKCQNANKHNKQVTTEQTTDMMYLIEHKNEAHCQPFMGAAEEEATLIAIFGALTLHLKIFSSFKKMYLMTLFCMH
jgi:hypothetical protein